MEDDEYCISHIRSSAAFRRGVRMINSVAVIDSDFYNNETNEGEISLGLLSHNDGVVHIKRVNASLKAYSTNF